MIKNFHDKKEEEYDDFTSYSYLLNTKELLEAKKQLSKQNVENYAVVKDNNLHILSYVIEKNP